MLTALPALLALDRDGRLRQRLAAAFAQTVQEQRPQLEGPAPRPPHQRAAHTLHAAALQLGADELAALCKRLETELADAGSLQRLDALLAHAQRELENP